MLTNIKKYCLLFLLMNSYTFYFNMSPFVVRRAIYNSYSTIYKNASAQFRAGIVKVAYSFESKDENFELYQGDLEFWRGGRNRPLTKEQEEQKCHFGRHVNKQIQDINEVAPNPESARSYKYERSTCKSLPTHVPRLNDDVAPNA